MTIQTGPFMGRPDLLALFRVSALKTDPRYPAIWQWYDGAGFRNGPEDLCGVEDWGAMAWFVPECRLMAAQEVDQALILTPVDEVIVAMGRLSANLQGDAFGYPGAGRPTWQLAGSMVLPHHLRGMRKKAEGTNRPEWLTDGFGLEFARSRIRNTPADVGAAVSWWFNPDSYGWTGQPEYDNMVRSIDGLIGDASRMSVLEHWHFWGGEDDEFDTLWDGLAQDMTEIREDLVGHAPAQDHTPFSYAPYYPVMFDRLGITHNFKDFKEEAERRWRLLNDEANRLTRQMGHSSWKEFVHNYDFSDPDGPQLLENDEALEQAYQNACTESERLFRQAGALTATWGEHHTMDVSLLGPSQIHSTPTAMVMCADRSDDPSNPVHVMMQVGGWEALDDEEQAAQRRQHQSMMHNITAAHELVHVWTNWLQAGRVPVSWSGPSVTGIGIEGAAFCAEMLWLEYADTPTPVDAIVMLQHRMQRLGRVVVEYLYHVEGVSFEEIVPIYANFCGLSIEDARIEASRMTTTPLQFCSYVIGSWAIEAAAEHSFGDDLTACWRGFMEDTAACMFPSWWLQATQRVDDRGTVPWIPKRCYPIELTQRLFPDS